MFKKVTKKVIKRAFDEAKETAKEEIAATIDKRLPIILGVVTIGITILSLIETKKPKMPDAISTTTIINNYYYFGDVRK